METLITPSSIEKNRDLRAKRVDYTLRCIELADRLGAQNISTEPGGPLEEMNREEGLRLFREGLCAVEDKAREKGVRVLIKPEDRSSYSKQRRIPGFF